MNKIKYIVIAIVLLATGTAFGATAKKVIDVYQKDYIAQIATGSGDMQIYKVDDGKNTCYLSYHRISDGSMKAYQHSLSCVKN